MIPKGSLDDTGSIAKLGVLSRPDPVSLMMAPLGFGGEANDPQRAARAYHASIAAAVLVDQVPKSTRSMFQRVLSVYMHGVFDYGLFTLAADNAWLVLEHALGERFVSFYTWSSSRPAKER